MIIGLALYSCVANCAVGQIPKQLAYAVGSTTSVSDYLHILLMKLICSLQFSHLKEVFLIKTLDTAFCYSVDTLLQECKVSIDLWLVIFCMIFSGTFAWNIALAPVACKL